MGAVATKATADLGRRRLQAAVLAVVLFLASGAATLALNILVASQAPFEQAFARANGAHLVIDFDAATSDAALAATQATDVVSASAGPWPVTTADTRRLLPRRPGNFGSSVAGRHDRRRPISAGRWWSGPGEVVIGRETAEMFGLQVGQTVDLSATAHGQAIPGGPAAGAPEGGGGPRLVPPKAEAGSQTPVMTLTVVGIAQSVSTPDVGGLDESHRTWRQSIRRERLARQMLYRVEPSATAADLQAAVAAITDGLSTGRRREHVHLSRDQGRRRRRPPACTSRSCSRSRPSPWPRPRSRSRTSSAASSSRATATSAS